MKIEDWEKLAKKLGAINEDGSEVGSSHIAQLAIDEIIGHEFLKKSVNYYLDGLGSNGQKMFSHTN